MKLETLRTAFPKTRPNAAVTGNIPMDYFEMNETAIRSAMREEGLKAIYRGPRISNNCTCTAFSMTRRCDATSVLLYRK